MLWFAQGAGLLVPRLPVAVLVSGFLSWVRFFTAPLRALSPNGLLTAIASCFGDNRRLEPLFLNPLFGSPWHLVVDLIEESWSCSTFSRATYLPSDCCHEGIKKGSSMKTAALIVATLALGVTAISAPAGARGRGFGPGIGFGIAAGALAAGAYGAYGPGYGYGYGPGYYGPRYAYAPGYGYGPRYYRPRYYRYY
jgi:hypothetical protein